MTTQATVCVCKMLGSCLPAWGDLLRVMAGLSCGPGEDKAIIAYGRNDYLGETHMLLKAQGCS